jgi:hypothetical protein
MHLTTCAAVSTSADRSLQKLIRKQSAELGVLQSTMQDHMKKDLNLKLKTAEMLKAWLISRLGDKRTRGRCAAALEWSTCTFCPHCA